jgi:hypothetical protein
MTRRARSALGADALRGLLGAEDLGPPPAPAGPTAAAPPPAHVEPPAATPPSKPAKPRAPRRRRVSPRSAPPVRPPSSEPPLAGAVEPAAGFGTDAGEPSQPPAPEPRTPRTNVQGYIDAGVLDRARDAAFWTPGVSLSALIEQGLRVEVARLEADRGEPFPRRRGPLKPGPAVR